MSATFDLLVDISDHTGTLQGCNLSGTVAEKTLGCTVSTNNFIFFFKIRSSLLILQWENEIVTVAQAVDMENVQWKNKQLEKNCRKQKK